MGPNTGQISALIQQGLFIITSATFTCQGEDFSLADFHKDLLQEAVSILAPIYPADFRGWSARAKERLFFSPLGRGFASYSKTVTQKERTAEPLGVV